MAQRYGKTPAAFRQFLWRRRGLLPTFNIGRRVLFDPVAFDEALIAMNSQARR